MKKIEGKIILVDDDLFEKKLIEGALKKLKWEIDIKYFDKPDEALKYLKETRDDIFIVISDMDMPQMSGLQLKREIDSDRELKTRAIPFIFSSNTATRDQVYNAYDYGIQGYFKKPLTVDEMVKILDAMIKYWIISLNPNKMK